VVLDEALHVVEDVLLSLGERHCRLGRGGGGVAEERPNRIYPKQVRRASNPLSIPSPAAADRLDILSRIVATKEQEVAALRPQADALRERAAAAPPARGFAAALRRDDRVRLLAEIKRRSPSAGPIRPGATA